MAIYLDVVCTEHDDFHPHCRERVSRFAENRRSDHRTNPREEQSLRVIGEILPFVLAKYSLPDNEMHSDRDSHNNHGAASDHGAKSPSPW